MATSTTIPNSDITLRRHGDGDRAVVFVHGFLDDQHVWDRVVADLAAPGFEIVQFDQAGFGGRREPVEPITLELFAGDLGAVVDAVDKPFVLVGHSMAAPIVELVAAARPGRTVGLVLVAPIPLAGTHFPPETMELFGTVDTFLGARRQVAPSTPEAELERVAAAAAKIRPAFLRSASDIWNTGQPDGQRPSRFIGPVLILPGADDPLVTPEVVASAVFNRFDPAKSTVIEIEQSSHWPHVERSSVVAEILGRFLTRDLPTEAPGRADSPVRL